MVPELVPGPEVVDRAVAWTQRARRRFCDHVDRWEHGLVTRAFRFPGSFELNSVHVHDEPRMAAGDLAAFANEALEGLGHRRLVFDRSAVAEPLRAAFHKLGFQSTRLTLMRFIGQPPSNPAIPVTEVAYDAVGQLRQAWYQEDFPGQDGTAFEAQARVMRLTLGSRVFAVYDADEPVAFAALDVGEDQSEIAGLFVSPSHRGHGRGTALTEAAIIAAGQVRDLWICADDEDRPKDLYTRLGFQPVLTWTEFLRFPA